MDLISTDIRNHILDKLREATFCISLCNCCETTSLVFKMERALCIQKDVTTAECSVLKSKGSMMTQFLGFDLLERHCDHIPSRNFRATFDQMQWKVLSEHGFQAIAIGARFRDGVLDVSSEKCAILPFDRHVLQSGHSKTMTFAELFAGGFSGWNFIVRHLQRNGVDIRHMWSIDKDPDCREAFVHTHKPDVVAVTKDQFWSDFVAKNHQQDHCSVFVQAPIAERWWLTAFPELLDLLVASPPCPPWAVTNHAPGFARLDGLTFLEIMQYVVWIDH